MSACLMSRGLRLLLVLGLLAPAAVLADEPVDAEVTTLRGSLVAE